MSVKIECVYSSCACNKTPNAVDWGNNNKICYSACNSIHIFSYLESGGGSHEHILLGHTKLVTSVHWLKKSNHAAEIELISTSVDNTAIIWTWNGSEFELSSSLIGHSNVVRNATGIYFSRNKEESLIVATLSIDSSVKIWLRKTTNEISCIQTIHLKNGFAIDVKFYPLSNGEIVLMMSQDDSKIHLYVQDEHDMFIPAIKLIGHEDWVQSVDIADKNSDSFWIASGSQDCYIRVWEVAMCNRTPARSTDLKVDATTFSTLAGNTYSVKLDSVLSGHENWIYSVQWYKNDSNDCLQLLSSSMDKSVIIWECDSDIWLEKVRVGEVGGNTMGFYGAIFSPDAKVMLAHGHHGAIYIWQVNEEEDLWQPGLSFGGHYAPVQDLDWDPKGEYILSCSLDQTTRLHAPFVTSESRKTWFEMARPQIHGYDMICLNVLNRYKYVSAGDEKILRVFEAPRSFAENLKNLSNLDTSLYAFENLAEGASVPSLGLSNKAVYEKDMTANTEDETDLSKHPKDKYPEYYYSPILLTAPPTEDTLLQNTLWPETQKLYGHPYEVYTVTSNNAKTLVASACKASKAEHAGIMLWETSTWKQVSFLAFHTLTITQMEFSPNDQYLLSVSRDRMWAVYQHFPNENSLYRLVSYLDKKSNVHTRIIWSCSWSFDSQYFATASRDKKIAVWSKAVNTEEGPEVFNLSSIPFNVEDSATAIVFAPCLVFNKYLLAIGLENGMISLSTWCITSQWTLLHTLHQNLAHHSNINRLKFSPSCGEAGNKNKEQNILQLASCSNDCHLKVFTIHLI